MWWKYRGEGLEDLFHPIIDPESWLRTVEMAYSLCECGVPRKGARPREKRIVRGRIKSALGSHLHILVRRRCTE